MRTSETTVNYDKDWIKVQPLIGSADKDGKSNRHQYATLTSVIHLVKPILNKGGFIFEQSLDIYESSVGEVRDIVKTRITHVKSGEWKESTSLCTSDANTNPQKHGISITYLKRYQLKAFCGMPEVDDDAEGYAKAGYVEKPPTPKRKPKTAVEMSTDHVLSIKNIDELLEVENQVEVSYKLTADEKDIVFKAIEEQKHNLIKNKLGGK